MSKGGTKAKEDLATLYERRGVLGALDKMPVEFALEEEPRRQILAGKRTRRLHLTLAF